MTTVTTQGPLFDGRAQRQRVAMTAEMVDTVSQEAFHEVGRILDAELANPTGYYESRVTVDRSRDDAVVHDSNVVYGPWLEGVSSRNETTRFKGYAAFRRATQDVEARLLKLVAPIAAKHVQRMN